jgi:hypothetical protein
MAWETNLLILVRSLINDSVAPYTYSDERLEDLMVTSAVLVLQEVSFATVYTIDLSTPSISPDPETSFETLIALKTACLIAQGEHRGYVRGAIAIKDGPSTIDAKGRAQYSKDLVDSVCALYDKARTQYVINGGSSGVAIITPYNFQDVGMRQFRDG